MSQLSSESLFHFTDSMDNLINILYEGFEIRYSLDKLPYGVDEVEVALPMVCFCDIPLSRTKEHTNKYGYYCIGLKKSWGQSNRLNPVLYLSSQSNVYLTLRELGNLIYDQYKAIQESGARNFFNSYINQYFHEVMMFTKPYKGDMVRKGKIIKDVIFYNEKEWRFINQGFQLHLEKEKFEDIYERQKYHSLAKIIGNLRFQLDDIKYLIVHEENERKQIIEIVSKGKFKNEDFVDELLSRILTFEQIENDF